MEIIKRYFKGAKSSYFLFGPRGTGKTTWLKLNCKNELTVDLLKPDVYRRFKARPERLREIIEGNPDKKIVIIDEVQKVPELLDPVHSLMEEKKELLFILTGSSARKIKQKGVDLLGGRALVRSLHPFMASELEDKFDLKKALHTGLVPLVVSSQRAVVQHPKFYFFDAGVFRTLRPSGPLDQPGEIDGPALEGLVAQHIRAWIDYSRSSCKLYYWRTKAGTEVDFVIYGKEGFWAIEVKNTRNIRNNDLRPLKTFHQDYPECNPLFVYRGDEKLLIDNILCVPCETFLKSIKPSWSLISQA